MVLHAIWDPFQEKFGLWGEGAEFLETSQSTNEVVRRQKKRGKGKKAGTKRLSPGLPVPHPFAIPGEILLRITEEFFTDYLWVKGLAEIGDAIIDLPTEEAHPLTSPELLISSTIPEEEITKEIELPAGEGLNLVLKKSPSRKKISKQTTKSRPKRRNTLQLRPWNVPVLWLPGNNLLEMLVTVNEVYGEKYNANVVLGKSFNFWAEVAKLALEVMYLEDYLPLIKNGGEEGGTMRVMWSVVIPQELLEQLDRLEQGMPPVCKAIAILRTGKGDLQNSNILTFLDYLIDKYVRVTIKQYDELIDSSIPTLQQRRGRRKKTEIVAEKFTQALISESPAIEVLEKDLGGLASTWQQWIAQAQPGNTSEKAFRTCFQLAPPEDGASTRAKWTIEYYLQAYDDPSLLVPAEKVWKERSGTIKYLKHRFENPQEKLLEDLGKAARIFPTIETSLQDARPAGLSLSTRHAYSFLQETAPALEQSGFGVIVPPWWRKPQGRLGISLQVRPKEQPRVGLTLFGMQDLVEYDWQVTLGGGPISPEEFEKLAKLKVPLVKVRGQWVEFNPQELEKLLGFFKGSKDARNLSGEMTLNDAFQLSLGQTPSDLDLPVMAVTGEGPLAEIFTQFQTGMEVSQITPIQVPRTFQGTLRPYQIIGVSWLAFLRQFGFGACLADDMGLGKTIEIIALLLHDLDLISQGDWNQENALEHSLPRGRKKGRAKSGPNNQIKKESTIKRGKNPPALTSGVRTTLIICPMSIVSNWAREIARFAPTLKVLIHHGKDRCSAPTFYDTVNQYDVVITTYALSHRDKALFEQIWWTNIIVDEAQNIKNSTAKTTQAIKALQGSYRIALTGTPIENRLAELWSIMDFLNAGYLGKASDFHAKFAIPIERFRDPLQMETLKRLIQPFVLRRLKTDKSIIQDLPEKVEIDVLCDLTVEQASLYEATVQAMLESISDSTGIQRRGLILATIMKLKQICNHPALFLHDGSIFGNRSGKARRLREMLEEILASGEKALIFTQFSEMGAMLRNFLQEALNTEVLFLYGATPKKQRDLMIERFQQDKTGPAIFIISLKAGGVGLNLTAANHVFHFDRWWNPAVEMQASDRAYRIGQTKKVQVYKYTCAGTLEERIQEIIEVKRQLIDNIIGTGEGWITEFTTEQLKELFALNREITGVE